MTDTATADAFLERISSFMTRIAAELGLGTAKGHFRHPKLGRNRTFTVFGVYLRLQLALVIEGTELMLSRETVRMRWYFWPLEAEQDISRLPGAPPLMETMEGFDEIERRFRRVLGWIHDTGGTAMDVFRELGETAVSRTDGGKVHEAKTDPDNELPSEDPHDDGSPS